MSKIDLKYLIAYVGPLVGYVALYQGGIFSYGGFILAFVIIPGIELFMNPTGANLSSEEKSARANLRYYDLLLYSHAPLLLGLIFAYLWRITEMPLLWWELLGMTLTVGIFIGTFGINVAHELGHRKEKQSQFVAQVLLLPALYLHFLIEHNRGHHRHVATPKDPATAQYGETLYAFWYRSIVGQLRSAWDIEKDRVTKKRKEGREVRNQMISFLLLEAAYLLVVTILFGWFGLLAAVAIALIGILLLESINYIEHYGLLRRRTDQGHYERVDRRHSWDSNYHLGRIFLYELTRHAHHHQKASVKYQILDRSEESPQMPAGYPAMILLSLCPPLFFSVMNKRVPLPMQSRAEKE